MRGENLVYGFVFVICQLQSLFCSNISHYCTGVLVIMLKVNLFGYPCQQVICSAEMKSKAELVVELDKMSKVRDELTQEVLSLSGQVEQERSKVNQLTLDLKKMSVSILHLTKSC